jgi:hypothetical protein
LPLSVRARVELYLPDKPTAIYKDLLATIVNEFTTSFGGCTVGRDFEGHYYSDAKQIVSESVLVVYSDTNFDFEQNGQALAEYAEELRDYAFNALDEEEILVAVWPVYHSI